jgi:hypothetical protein
MEQQVLKIIKKRINQIQTQEGLSVKITSNEDKAKEITSMVFEFVEWTQEEKWGKYKGLDWWVKKDNKIPPKNPPLTLNELFQYWWDNVKNK